MSTAERMTRILMDSTIDTNSKKNVESSNVVLGFSTENKLVKALPITVINLTIKTNKMGKEKKPCSSEERLQICSNILRFCTIIFKAL